MTYRSDHRFINGVCSSFSIELTDQITITPAIAGPDYERRFLPTHQAAANNLQ